jgi:O-6-methylguanine DNA methyltransferase
LLAIKASYYTSEMLFSVFLVEHCGSIVKVVEFVQPLCYNVLMGTSIVIVPKSPQRKIHIDVFVDFLCPFCGKFQKNWGSALNRLVEYGKISLEYHPLVWIDQYSNGAHYSLRSACASLLVASADSDTSGVQCTSSSQAWSYISKLFERGVQPQEAARYSEEAGSNEALANHAAEIGAPISVADQIRSGEFGSLPETLKTLTEEIRLHGTIPHTPSVFINGTYWEHDTPVDIKCLNHSYSDFGRSVMARIAQIPRGEVRSYAQIAAEVGSPRAARAVGTVCRTNPLPLLIPCHRVVPSSFLTAPLRKNIGQYSLGGADIKWALLCEELGCA